MGALPQLHVLADALILFVAVLGPPVILPLLLTGVEWIWSNRSKLTLTR